VKVALFKNTQFDYVSPWQDVPLTDGWIQVSGWVEVEFPPLSENERRISEELLALGKRQASFEADFRRQKKALEDERAALLKTGT
jgi:hypothetical protein